jgi:signal transduction histidine kinase/ligand-binding sensor domain-containing protein
MIKITGLAMSKLIRVFHLSALLILLSACGGFRGSQPAELDHIQLQANLPGQIVEWPENSPGFPLGQHFRFDHISLEQGLSQSHVLSMLQDSQGFMWFGTEDGLNKYDGYTFTVYKYDPENPNSLSNNWILALFEDHAGTFWIGTRGGGLNSYNRNLDQFTHYQNDPEDPASLSDNEITAIYEGREHVLWVGTHYGGLNRYDQEEQTFTHYQHNPDDPNSLSSNAVTVIYEDQNGILWVGTEDDGLNRFDRETEQWWHFKNDPADPHSISHNTITAITKDQTGALWVGTGSGGLNKLSLKATGGFDPEDQRFIHYQHNPNDRESLGSNEITAVYQDLDGALWVGTYGSGLDRFDSELEIFIHYKNLPGDLYSLSNDFVASIYQDREGNLWVGTVAGGINKLDVERWNFAHFQNEPNDPNSLGNNMVRALHQDQDGALWVGTLFGGLDLFDPDSMNWYHFRYNPDDPGSLSSDWVSIIFQDQSGLFWIGTASGLDRYNPETKTFIHYQPEPDAPPQSPSNDVVTIFQEKSGELWIGTFGGLYQFDWEKEIWSQPYPNNSSDLISLSDAAIWSVYEDKEGVLWIGTLGGGLYRFDSEKDVITNYQYNPDEPSGLSSNIVGAMFQDHEGILWISTQVGLNRFDPETGIFNHYLEKDGLPNDAVYCLQEDAQGFLWLSSNLGLSKFDPQRETFLNYDVTDGLQNNEFNAKACEVGDDGEMFFGGINGFNIFYPDQLIDNPYIPPVVITSLTINNEEIALTRDADHYQDIILDWPVDSIEFGYAALSFAQPENNQYAYYLDGFEETWKAVGTRRFGEYTSLPGGEYTLRIKGSNNNGTWNELGVAMKITVVPPFWQTAWFYGLVIIAALGLFYAGYRVRVRSLEVRGRELEQQVEQRTSELMQTQAELKQIEMDKVISEERNRLARDLHDSVTQSIYSLTLLSEAGQRMIANEDFVQIKENQTRLGEISQQALQEMRLLVYELRPQILENEGLIGALEHRLAAVERRAGINARLLSTQEIYLPQNIEEELFYISMEALNNALKHAKASEVVVSLKIEKESLILTIEDNGRGFDPKLAVSQGGMGLSSMTERVEKVGGSLSIQSEDGAGTIISVSVPVKVDPKLSNLDTEENYD